MSSGRAGINFKHNSAQGGIDDVLLDDNYYDTNLGLDYSFRDRDLSYTIGLDALHKQYNWYGFSNNIIVTNDNLNRTDVVQNYGAFAPPPPVVRAIRPKLCRISRIQNGRVFALRLHFDSTGGGGQNTQNAP